MILLRRAGGHGNNIQRHTVVGSQTYYEVEPLPTQSSFYEIWLTATNRAGVGEKSKVLRYSPNFKGKKLLLFNSNRRLILHTLANNAAICSFGRRVVQPWKSSIDFPCRTVGNSVQQPNWTFNGKPYRPVGLEAGNNRSNNGNLILSDLKKSDAGNYTCWIKSDSVSYQLIVIGIT